MKTLYNNEIGRKNKFFVGSISNLKSFVEMEIALSPDIYHNFKEHRISFALYGMAFS